MMGIEFIMRTLKTAGALSLLVLIFGTSYYGFYPSLSVFTGMIWGMVNLYFLSLLVRSTLKPDGVEMKTALVLLLIKFPLLYITGYLMVTSDFFKPILLLVGFTMVLVVMVLKAVGRTILNLDSGSTEDRQGTLKSVQ